MYNVLSVRGLSIVASVALASMSFAASATIISQIGLNPQNSSVSNQIQVTPSVWVANPGSTIWYAQFSPYITQMGHVLTNTSNPIPIPQNANAASWGGSLNGLQCDNTTYKSTMPSPTNKFGQDSSFTPWITFHVSGTGTSVKVDKCWIANAAE